ncbi:hypothetical protein E1A91_A07G124900v1, partial [Gossypium mustelinum]
MLEEFLKVRLIMLLKIKQPEEVDRVDNPNYCRYHNLSNHPLKKCSISKEKIIQLYNEGKITFEEETYLKLTSIT